MDTSIARERIDAYAADRHVRYDELTELVQAFAAAYPELCSLESIGTSPAGRSIWALTLTSQASGAPESKPGMLLESNIHAGEVTGAAAALATVKRLLTQYGQDREVTRLLDLNTLYVVPCLAVDGAEFYLSTEFMVRSSPLPYPDALSQLEGLVAQDIDGDGRIRVMRKQDLLGEWKISALDPRIMVRRKPEDWEGPFYRLYPEGLLEGYENRAPQGVKLTRPNRGLDFNRNFPAHWSPEAKQPGAGRYPLDQPETRAIADFMLSRENISVYVALHTYGGVILRPPSVAGDDSMNPSDLRLYGALGDLCERTTSYPVRSSYHAFFHTPGQPMTKGSKDWAYDHLGMVAYTLELWDLDSRAGAHAYREAGAKGMMSLTDRQREEDELKRLQWNDRELGGEGFKDWTPLHHPHLGEVEIGGWDEKNVRQNTPFKFLPDETRRVSEFVLKLGMTLPRLQVGETRVTWLEGNTYRVEVEVQNAGFLNTNTTKVGADLRVAKPVEVSLTLPAGAMLLSGRPTQELGHLEGFAAAADSQFYGAPAPVRSTAWAEWLVAAPAGAELTVRMAAPRAGNAETTVRIG